MMRDAERLAALDLAIQRQPDAPAHYLLRAEYHLAVGMPTVDILEAARADIERAQSLAEAALTDSAWGYIWQSYLDRAEQLMQRLAQAS